MSSLSFWAVVTDYYIDDSAIKEDMHYFLNEQNAREKFESYKRDIPTYKSWKPLYMKGDEVLYKISHEHDSRVVFESINSFADYNYVVVELMKCQTED